MKEITQKFSITDFFAYLFPGLIFLLAIYCFLLLCEIKINFQLEWFGGLTLLSVAFMLGILSSSLVSFLGFNEYWDSIDKTLQHKDVHQYLEEVKKTYNSYFNVEKNWNNQSYLMIRVVVRQLSPEATVFAERQNSLRQYKRNNVIPIFLLSIDGVIWGIITAIVNNNNLFYLISLILLFLAIIFPLALIRGMKRNRRLEVREYCLSFIHLCTQRIKQ